MAQLQLFLFFATIPFTVLAVLVEEQKRTQESLIDEQEQLTEAQRLAQVGSWQWDPETDTVTWSEELYRIAGRDPNSSAPSYKEHPQIYTHESWQRLQGAVEEALRTGKAYELDLEMVRPDGTARWVIARGEAQRDAAGRIAFLRGTVKDVTERKQAEEVRFKHVAIVESSDDAIISKNMDGIILGWNAGARRIFGFTEAEAVGQPITIIVPPELLDDENRIMQVLKADEPVEHYETVRVTKEGKKVHVSLTISPIRDSAGRVVGAYKIARDITGMKLAEAALRESEVRFRLVANTAPVMIWMSGLNKLCTYVNQPWLEFVGRSLEAELGSGWTEGVHSDDRERSWDTYCKAFDRHEPFHLEYRLRRHDGEYRWVIDSGVPRFNEDGSFAGYIGSAIDVTDRKLAEQALSTVSQKLIEAHEEERTRIARELHDDINQRLALLAVKLEILKQNPLASRAELQEVIGEAGEEVAELGSDVQALSHRLHSSKLDYLGLATAAAGFCREVSNRQGVEIDFHSENIPKDLSKEASLCLFRALQEAVQNATKHSGSRHFEVSLSGGLYEVELKVRDSGIGFDPEDAIRGSGLGLTSIRERLKLVNGDLAIDSRPQRGTTIHARVPLTPRTTKSAGAAG